MSVTSTQAATQGSVYGSASSAFQGPPNSTSGWDTDDSIALGAVATGIGIIGLGAFIASQKKDSAAKPQVRETVKRSLPETTAKAEGAAASDDFFADAARDWSKRGFASVEYPRSGSEKVLFCEPNASLHECAKNSLNAVFSLRDLPYLTYGDFTAIRDASRAEQIRTNPATEANPALAAAQDAPTYADPLEVRAMAESRGIHAEVFEPTHRDRNALEALLSGNGHGDLVIMRGRHWTALCRTPDGSILHVNGMHVTPEGKSMLEAYRRHMPARDYETATVHLPR